MSGTPPLQVETYLPYLRDVTRCEQSLHELNLMWRMIESSAKMNCPVEAKTILPTMAATRAGFNRLEQELVASLVNEKVSNALNAIGTKAQYAVDIVVRNLYERTADIGFLATDRELCSYVAGLHGDENAIRLRMRAYRNKYTVYDEIILLDLAGNVLVQIDASTPLEGSVDPLIEQTLESDTYVETFRATDLRPGKSKALIYSHRMRHPETGAIVGVLCLCFNFEEEMVSIFASHRDANGRSNMLLLDGENRVIASADSSWIPLNVVVPVNRAASPQLLVYAGREYLVRTFAAKGYQGYMGPVGWQGQVMLPVDLAFSGAASDHLNQLTPTVAKGLLTHASSFSPPLFEIMTATDTIQRVVWNGQVITAGQSGERQKLKSILEQISETGTRSSELFSQSIRDLYETVLESSLSDAEFVSHLLVDLLDRNLYERSDDCRWWALTPELRTTLACVVKSPEAVRQVAEILGYINKLYTVYTRIFVYDAAGTIVASTGESKVESPEFSAVGRKVDPDTLGQVCALAHEQAYYVSPFVASDLYGGAPTYIYHAAIRDPDDATRVVGGIGIVFDSTVELHAMLDGAMEDKTEMTAFFVNRQGRILASTDAGKPAGGLLAVDSDLRAIPNGSSESRAVVYDGNYAILGCSASNGYREFKVSDGYTEDVLCVVVTQLGAVQSDAGVSVTVDCSVDEMTTAGGREFATFFCGGNLFAMSAASVLEARPATEITRMTSVEIPERMGMLVRPGDGEDHSGNFVWTYDLSIPMHGKPTAIQSGSQVIIVEHGVHTVGLLVDALHGVPEFTDQQVMDSPFANTPIGRMVPRFIKAKNGQVLIQEIDVGALVEHLLRSPTTNPKAGYVTPSL
jgi:chemotaxis signal transduction protein